MYIFIYCTYLVYLLLICICIFVHNMYIFIFAITKIEYVDRIYVDEDRK